ncbi:MAG: hypothetical protein AABX63_01435, partial [Nanoarchaeota archaeon]
NLELSKCVDGKKPVEFLDYKWDLDARSSIYGFCVKSSSPKVYAYEKSDNTIGLKDITYRFALPFEDLKCTLQGNPELVNTKCMESSCNAYYSCNDATSSCYCVPGTGNACQGKCLPFCSSSNPNVAVDIEPPVTKCKKFSCSSYMSCSDVAADTCGCPSPDAPENSHACTGADCDTLHCEKDLLSTTSCRDDCSKYGQPCMKTSVCGCDSGVACEGICSCIPQSPREGSCGEGGCPSNTRPRYRDFEPPTCKSSDFLGCTACDPSCDPCDCNYGSKCGACGWDECPPPPPPPPPPGDDSCQGRCGSQAPSGCWCDYQSESSQGCEFYGDCCSDYSQHCGS